MSESKIFDPAQDKTVPTPVRINSVLYYMEKEPSTKERMSKVLVGVKKRSGEAVYFPKEVYDVAAKLHADGKDALDIGKSEILLAAREVLGLGPATPSVPPRSLTATPTGAKVVRQTIHAMLVLAGELLADIDTRAVPSDELVADIAKLREKLGLEGKPAMTPVVPYTLLLSASQLSGIDADLAKHQGAFGAVIQKLQKVTVET